MFTLSRVSLCEKKRPRDNTSEPTTDQWRGKKEGNRSEEKHDRDTKARDTKRVTRSTMSILPLVSSRIRSSKSYFYQPFSTYNFNRSISIFLSVTIFIALHVQRIDRVFRTASVRPAGGKCCQSLSFSFDTVFLLDLPTTTSSSRSSFLFFLLASFFYFVLFFFFSF